MIVFAVECITVLISIDSLCDAGDTLNEFKGSSYDVALSQSIGIVL